MYYYTIFQLNAFSLRSRPPSFTHIMTKSILKTNLFTKGGTYMSSQAQHERILNFAVSIGELMLKSGAETYRVEDTITRILNVHAFKRVDTFVVPTGIMVTIEGETFSLYTKVARVKNRSNRLDRIERLNQLSRDYVGGKLTLEEGLDKLEEIRLAPGYSPRMVILWIGISCSFFAVMFHAGVLEFILSFFIGLGVGFLQYRLGEKQIVNFFSLFISSSFLGFITMFCKFIFGDKINIDPIIIGCIMPLLPGLAFTTAVRDAIGDELISGITRGAEALLAATTLAAGIGISLSICNFIGGLLS